jgi:hypothetical protein
VVATLSWASTEGVEHRGLPVRHSGDLTVAPAQPSIGAGRMPEAGVPVVPRKLSRPGRAPVRPRIPAERGVPAEWGMQPEMGVPEAGTIARGGSRSGRCRTGHKLVPTCGVLWGVAPGAFTDKRGPRALAAFEKKTGRHQDIYHAYHNGTGQLFPTDDQIALARQRGEKRILFLSWRPDGASWAEIARGDKRTDAYLDRLARHINQNFGEDFFFSVHHEGENEVKEKRGSGYTAQDYSNMYRHVVHRLRARGVDNLVTVLVHMAYVPHTTKSWFDRMYPGDDVVDWIGFDSYAYSDPGYGHGDFAEMLNRRMESRPSWPGFYNWAVRKHGDKPLMVAEWGVWSSKKNPEHKADFYREVGEQIRKFPKIRAMVHFDTPHNRKGQDSRVDTTQAALKAYRRLGDLPVFQVQVTNGRS